MHRFVLFLVLGFAPATVAQIERPRLGLALDGSGELRPVLGIAASATFGDPVASGVVAFACAKASCVAKTDTSIVSLPGSHADDSARVSEAPESRALIALDAAGAFVYFESTGTTARWTAAAEAEGATQLESVAFDPSGELLAIRSTRDSGADGFDYAVMREGLVWIEHFSIDDHSITAIGAIDIDTDVGSNEPARQIHAVLLLKGGYVAASNTGISIVHADGSRRDFDVGGVTALYTMSEENVEAVTARGNWILRVTGGYESTNALPGVAQ